MKTFSAGLVLVAALLAGGCGKKTAEPAAPHLHVDVPPHGGIPTALDDDYQIEWVRDIAGGKIQAYILDGEMENFVRIGAPSFDVTAQLPDGPKVLHFAAVPNTATGETVGSTSLFEAKTDGLTTTNKFAAILRELDVKGTAFTNVAFEMGAP